MMQSYFDSIPKVRIGSWVLLTLVIGAFLGANALAAVNLTVNGVNKDGTTTALSEYRWLIEEDQTYHVQRNASGQVQTDAAGNPILDPNWRVGDPLKNTLSVSFHRSYMPVVAKGSVPLDTANPRETALASLDLDSDKNYHVSVIPKEAGTYSIGGAAVEFDAAGNASATVYLNENPIPTAQITIFVFEDTLPINNAPDATEQGLAGFSILLEDACGKYGACAGAQSKDAFGNNLGTEYLSTCDAFGQPDGDPNTNFGCLDADGNPIISGSHPLVTGPDGTITIKNLAPGKYGVQAVPPVGSGYQQTATIEGKKVIDAWVKANEPPFFAEFGPPGYHAFIGFVKEFNKIPSANGSSATISGQVTNLHISRPPGSAFYSGAPFTHTTPWIGLNNNAGLAGASEGIYVARTDGGSFDIPAVPPGDYQLVVFDDNMDLIFGFHGITVKADGTCNTVDGDCDLGDVPVFQWFTRLEHEVFLDTNENGVRDANELTPIPEQAVNLRWRDGTVYQSFPTDSEGFVPFDEVFPFFSWLVAEVDFLRFKATGVTVTVDDGGPIPFGDPSTFGSQLNPQPQGNPPDQDIGVTTATNRTEEGPVLTQGFQGFLGQTSVMQWGKTSYGRGENGGISGVVYYAVTRAEDDPAKAAVELWEPGIPRVQVTLYEDKVINATGLPGSDQIPDDRNNNGLNYADIDNYPFNWNPSLCGDTCTGMGPEDVNRSGNTTNFNFGDAIMITTTDSWDDNLPSNCQYGANASVPGEAPFEFRGVRTDCYDGIRNFNQVRPGVFDGGYAFTEYFINPNNGNVLPPWNPNGVATPLPEGLYIVEASPPPAYEIAMQEDRNVDFGESYIPSPGLLPPPCVGGPHEVPAELTLFPGVPVGSNFGGTTQPLCDRKLVTLSTGANAAADFNFFTEVPVAGHIIGFILDDTANEFDPAAPTFGEKFAPPFLPVSIQDWQGREISRTYSDEYGVYNALVPSTYTANLPQPSGMSPNMLTTCMNHPTLADGTEDPLFNPQYSTFCYTFQYMPGSTTYLDTPVVPTAAFAGPGQYPLDCEFPDATPRIRRVTVGGNGVGGGPYIALNSNGTIRAGQSITIQSMGQVSVPNPEYEGVGGTTPPTISRNYGFGGQRGTVTLGGVPLTNITTWNNGRIVAALTPAQLNALAVGGHPLVVTRATGVSTIMGMTVQKGLRAGASVRTVSPGPVDAQGNGPIQRAIDQAGINDLILVRPGNYNEMVIMWKPVQLQGWGAGDTLINAINQPAEKLQAWREKLEQLVTNGDVDLLPGQEVAFGGIEPGTLFTEEGAGVLVLAKASGPRAFNRNQAGVQVNRGARISGFTIKGASTGGGIVVSGYGDFIDIANNVVKNNSGFFGGGVRVGHPEMINPLAENYQDADNDNVRIFNNQISQNGGQGGAGGGVSLCTGSDNYEVTKNWICGNFSLRDGGGIGHLGLSNNGLIANNKVLFNENFNQGQTFNGGGIFIGGLAPFGTDTLTQGSGRVTVNANLILGNAAGAGDGGGIRTSQVNGQDVQASGANENGWHLIDIANNMIINNVAGLAGGGISLGGDTARVRIMHNTVANNDSTATAAGAFSPSSPNQSSPQPAGIVARAHSAGLSTLLATIGCTSQFCDPENPNPFLLDNVIWHNRSFYFKIDPSQIPATTGLVPDVGAGGAAPVYDDLGVLGTLTAQYLDPRWSILTDRSEDAGHTYVANNQDTASGANPAFVNEYFNGGRGTTVVPGEPTTAIGVPAAFDEGGNFIRVRFGPLTLCDDPNPNNNDPGTCADYHIGIASTALNAGFASGAVILGTDFDGDPRPIGPGVDIGADENLFGGF
ncbi:hypothetical protein [Desulfococcus sp.]|uniref:hypothetical protein n=1 Tax=Desulfococcus sp. TaxID=2025834 RepID=UPI0035934EE3